MLQMEKNDLLSSDDDDVDAGSLPPPQMTINVTSTDVLQLTITKTSLEVFRNLAQVLIFCMLHICDSKSVENFYSYAISNFFFTMQASSQRNGRERLIVEQKMRC